MGIFFSSPETEGAAGSSGLEQLHAHAKNAYELLKKVTASGRKTGGCEGFFGGDEEAEPLPGLASYASSAAAEAKDRLIRGLARALKNAGMDVDPDDTLENIVERMRKVLPDPDTNNRGFRTNATSHARACEALAEAMNNEFTPAAAARDQLIDMSQGPEGVCRQVSSYVFSLGQGLQAEFLTVHRGIMKALANIEALDEVMGRIYGKIVGELNANVDSITSNKLEQFENAYAKLRAAHDRQHEILKSLLDASLGSKKEAIDKLFESEKATRTWLESLETLTPGTKDFTEVLTRVVRGLGTTSDLARRVHEALQAVGLSVEKFLASPDWEDFARLLDEKRFEASPESLAEFERAAAILRSTFTQAHREPEAVRGGEERRSEERTRVERLRDDRNLMVRQFLERRQVYMEDFLKAVRAVGPQLGLKVALSDKLGELRDALEAVREPANLSDMLSLININKGAQARDTRGSYLSQLRQVEKMLGELTQMEMYAGEPAALFEAMRTPVGMLLRQVDHYSDAVQKKFGGDGAIDLADFKVALRLGYGLKEARESFRYFMYIARVRENTARVAKELEGYSEKYPDVLGDAIAAKLMALEAARDKSLAALDTYLADTADAAVKKSCEAAKVMVKEAADAKRMLYRAIEALDLYLRAFTNGLVSNPDEVKDIRRCLEGVTVIVSWFTEESGDALSRFFEATPTADGSDSKAADIPAGKHYYEAVGDALTAAGAGRPVDTLGALLPMKADKADKAQQQVSAFMDKFQALKNLVSTFARIGQSFGGRDLNREVFMSPTQIYNALMRYMRLSAMSVGLAKSGAGATLDGLAAASGMPAAQAPAAPATPEEASVMAYVSMVAGAGGNSDLVGNWDEEDRHFAMMLKAMSAKVLTVLGMYEMTNRVDTSYANLAPLRMIVGGDAGRPQVVPAAAELYFRLPRLAEYYRKRLFKDLDSIETRKIGMLPEFEGIFSGLVQLVFADVSGSTVDSGAYSSSEVDSIVREVNSIYGHFHAKHGESATMKALDAFVDEVNRRYGIVKKEEYEAWNKLRKVGELGDIGDFATDFPILPGETTPEPSRLAPSDRFMRLGEGAARLERSAKYTIEGGDWKLVKDFRAQFEKDLLEAASAQNVQESYSGLIEQARRELREASDSEAQMRIVERLILGSGSQMPVDTSRFMMYHEAVVAPLNMLGALHGMLRGFATQMKDLDLAKHLDEAAADIVGSPAAATPASWLAAATGKITGGVRAIGDPLPYSGAGAPATLNTVAVVAGDKAKAEEFAMYAARHETYFRKMVAALFSISSKSGGLAAVRFPEGENVKITLDLSGVRGVVADLFAAVRRGFDMFRGIVDNKTIERDSETLKILDDYFNDDDGGILSEKEKAAAPTLTQAAKIANDILVRTVGAVAKGFQIDNEFASFVAPTVAPAAGAGLAGVPNIAALVPARAQNLYGDGGATGLRVRNLVSLFNRVLATYLNSVYDSASGKIYAGAINGFANGSLSAQVMQAGSTEVYDDTVAFVPGDPPKSPLTKSLATVMRNLLVEKVQPQNVSKYLVSTLAEVPLYIQEGMRANLPIYAKLMDQISEMAEFYKQLLQRTGLGANNQPRLQAIMVTLSNTASAAYSVSSTIMNLMRELGDESLYLQTEENSISNYRARYGKLPIMPLSLAMFYLTIDPVNIGGADLAELGALNPTAMGSAEFKLLYGTRKLLNSREAMALADMPGVEAVLNDYNGSVGAGAQMDRSRFEALTSTLVGALRFLVDSRVCRASMFDVSLTSKKMNRLPDTAEVFSLRGTTTAVDVVGVVETTYQADTLRRMLQPVAEGAGAAPVTGSARDRERISNLVTANIVPINVHALMRGMPLANLYNYAVTFEQMAAGLLGLQARDIDDMAGVQSDSAEAVKKSFLKLLFDPFVSVSSVEFATLQGAIPRMFRGEGIQMGRPKMLSDQVYGKALLGTGMASYALDGIAGPTADAARGIGASGNSTAAQSTIFDKLAFIDKDGAVKFVDIGGTDNRPDLLRLGFDRFNTRLVRKIIFITNMQRLLRMKMGQDLTQVSHVLASSDELVDPTITEYGRDGRFTAYETVGNLASTLR